MPFSREQRRQYMNRRRRAYRTELTQRLGGCCVQCGGEEELHFDHRDPRTREHKIADMVSTLTTGEAMKDELAKCQLLCRECHTRKSSREGAFRKNRLCGEDSPGAKLTKEDVLTIRRECVPYSKTWGVSALARRLGVSREAVGHALHRNTWAHVE